MRLWLAVVCAAAACFTEVPSDNPCPDGTPGCDCTSVGACDPGLECIVSIDKCVPIDCTPGSHTCVCTDAGACDDPDLCSGGVCLGPNGAGTGASTVSATTTTGPTSMTAGSSTDASGMQTTNDSLTTVSDTLDTSGTAVDTSLTTSASDTTPAGCPMCLEAASMGQCSVAFASCTSDGGAGGCNDLQMCVLAGGDVAGCCSDNDGGDNGQGRWNAFVSCASMTECSRECAPICAM